MRSTISLIILGLCIGSTIHADEPWSTYRGNSQRTGNTDNKPGPFQPNVLWFVKSKDQFLSSPVPAGNRLLVSGLGALNTAYFACLDTDPKAAKRVVWTPELTQATVSSPGLYGSNKLIFGDGMHQNNGANLYCLNLETGKRVWQLPVPGPLVHIEGSPVISGNKIYVGAGSAGVLAVDADKLILEGKEMDQPAIKKVLDQKWDELKAKYEKDKKDDPKSPFLREPSVDQLPMVQPKLLWQQGHQGKGKEKMHVDSPLAVVGDKVLVGSAYLDIEKEGDRALFCLEAGSGKIQWKTPLKLNPWGGPTVTGKMVIVTGSDINYDIKSISKKNKGVVAAYSLADGKEIWSKDVDKAAVISCAAVADGVAVVSATDGKIRAFEIDNMGARRWNQPYDTKAQCFAPVAIAGDVVYAGDLKGIVHAINLKTGEGLWTLDLAKVVGNPGMIYAGPVVQDGRLYVVTNNMEGANAFQDGAVVCIGAK
jgi:outer membrane protein assembly factor BamB